jgi:hypothetical protein
MIKCSQGQMPPSLRRSRSVSYYLTKLDGLQQAYVAGTGPQWLISGLLTPTHKLLNAHQAPGRQQYAARAA